MICFWFDGILWNWIFQLHLHFIWRKKFVKIKHKKCNFSNGSVQVNFYSLRLWLNRFKHSVKRFGRSGLDTLYTIYIPHYWSLHVSFTKIEIIYMSSNLSKYIYSLESRYNKVKTWSWSGGMLVTLCLVLRNIFNNSKNKTPDSKVLTALTIYILGCLVFHS